jgi:hypothetical protein
MAEEPKTKTARDRLLESRTLNEFKRVISSVLDIQNKMTSCDSKDISPHLNDDFPLGNFAQNDEIALKWNFILARTATDLGATDASMNWFHENNELTNITRGRFGFQNKIVRSNISDSKTQITENSGGGFFRRGKEDGQR